MKQKNEIDMLHGPLLSKILAFTLPLMATSILQLLFNAADTIVVGRFAGHTSLAAVGSTTSLIQLFVNLLLGLSIGTNVVVAQFLGAGKLQKIKEAVHTAMLMAAVGGVVMAIIGWVCAPQLLKAMATPDDVIGLSGLYLRIYFIGMPFQTIYNFSAAILRAKGDTRRPLIYLSVSGIMNVVLNLWFVIGLHMDVAGVALATIISQFVSGILVFRCLCMEKGPLHFSFNDLVFERESFVKMMRIGLPAGLQSTVFSLSNVVIQSTVNGFGSVVMAGNSAAISIEGFVYVSMNAFQQACQTFVGQNAGAGQFNRVKKILLRCLACATATGVLLGGLVILFGEQLCEIYSSDPEVIQWGMLRLLIICSTYFLCGIMDTMVGALRGIGYSVVPMIVSLIGACGFRLLWIAFVFPLSPVIENLYISYPISWLLTFIAHVIYWKIEWRKVEKMQVNRLERA
ncbi:MAG: MATE family efflux transporter [Lachnospiraceae bacterium]|nr:MATE family efflux transporter [Lachnospiraceae bacterium]